MFEAWLEIWPCDEFEDVMWALEKMKGTIGKNKKKKI